MQRHELVLLVHSIAAKPMALYPRTVEQGKLKNVQFEEKRSTRKYNGVKSSAQGDKKFKEKSDAK